MCTSRCRQATQPDWLTAACMQSLGALMLPCGAELLLAFADLGQTVLAAPKVCCWCCRGVITRPQHQCWPLLLHVLSCLPAAQSAAFKCQLWNLGTQQILIEAQSCRQVSCLPRLGHALMCSVRHSLAASLQDLSCPSEKQPCASLATASLPVNSACSRPVPTACSGMAAGPHLPRPADSVCVLLSECPSLALNLISFPTIILLAAPCCNDLR